MAEQLIDEIPERQEFLKKYEIKNVRFIKNLKKHEVKARKIRGNAGAYFDIKDMLVLNAHISELPCGPAPASSSLLNRASSSATLN